ncbi:cytochrome P450 [Nonomuraea cavernae]|uniref:Cytochrome P450 n=1 Tax=Nonomuraea cavernae TaxID=2045107 RepID=A0A917Z224_9ACTN|nr:cytochrome P450 [Nonomuraea cavernae]MCA2188534.1 cytochrome P450 [Nonomuraea cavernae]GGO73032.1 cytochrome P450 [Nonomuraea cavernae]
MTAPALSQIPGPTGRRLLDTTYEYERDRLGFITRCQREFGDVFRFSPTTVVVSHPDVIHDLFLRTNTDFRTEGSLFSGDRTPWEEQAQETESNMLARRKGWRGVSRSAAGAHGARFLDHLDTLVRGSGGRAVEVFPMMKAFSGFAVADYCLGGHGDDVTGIADAIDAGASASVRLMASSLSLPRWLPLPSVLRAKRTKRRAMARLERHVAGRSPGLAGAEPRDLLDVLLAGRGAALDRAAVVRLMDVVLRASHGVPGATLAWAVRQFALRPEHLERVRTEGEVVRAARHGESVAVSEFPYTAAFLNELLRAFPPTWLMGRWVQRDTGLAGFRLRRGEQVMFSAHHVHRDPRWWDDPHEFRPERWLERDRPYVGRAYFPFGAGPRICFGNQLGLVQLTLTIAWLAAAYDIEAINVTEALPAPEALFVPSGLEARFRPRRAST